MAKFEPPLNVFITIELPTPLTGQQIMEATRNMAGEQYRQVPTYVVNDDIKYAVGSHGVPTGMIVVADADLRMFVIDPMKSYGIDPERSYSTLAIANYDWSSDEEETIQLLPGPQADLRQEIIGSMRLFAEGLQEELEKLSG